MKGINKLSIHLDKKEVLEMIVNSVLDWQRESASHKVGRVSKGKK